MTDIDPVFGATWSGLPGMVMSVSGTSVKKRVPLIPSTVNPEDLTLNPSTSAWNLFA